MKNFIEYLDFGVMDKKGLINPCGDRSVFILDGRNSIDTMINDGYENNGIRRPFYPFFRVIKNNRVVYSNVKKGYHLIEGMSHGN